MILFGLLCSLTFQNFYKNEPMEKSSVNIGNALNSSEQELQNTKYEMSSMAMPQPASLNLAAQAPIRIKLKRSPAKSKSKNKVSKKSHKKSKKKKSKSSQRP